MLRLRHLEIVNCSISKCQHCDYKIDHAVGSTTSKYLFYERLYEVPLNKYRCTTLLHAFKIYTISRKYAALNDMTPSPTICLIYSKELSVLKETSVVISLYQLKLTNFSFKIGKLVPLKN